MGRCVTDRLPEALVSALGGALPEAGAWYPVHLLLTAGAVGGPTGSAPAVCLLSRAEVRATPATVSVAARSTRAAANIAVTGQATLVAWAGKLHYVTMSLRDTVAAREGAHGYLFDVRDVRVDDIGIELRPLEYRMEAWLAAAERWETTSAILDELAVLAGPLTLTGGLASTRLRSQSWSQRGASSPRTMSPEAAGTACPVRRPSRARPSAISGVTWAL